MASPLLSGNQGRFLAALAQTTRLNPNVLGAWLRNEEPRVDQNTDPAGHGRYNFLNVGITDSGPRGAASSYWNTTPEAAGAATGNWLLGRLSIPGFGRSAPSIQALAKVAGAPASAQIAAIQHSGWASGGETALPSLFQQIAGSGGVPVKPGAAAAVAPAQTGRAATAATQVGGAAATAAPATPDYGIVQRSLDLGEQFRRQAAQSLTALGGTAPKIAPALSLATGGAATPLTPITPSAKSDTIVNLKTGSVVAGKQKVSPAGQKALALAREFIGTPYLYGGASPHGFDCSGLLAYTYGKLGITIPHNAQAQYDLASKTGILNAKQLQPGDAVFFRDQSGIHHVGMYVGGKDREFIQAPHTGDHVKISSLNEPYYRSQFAGGGRFT